MTGPLFFVPPGDVEGERVYLRGEQARHLAVVLRAAPGMPVTIADGAGAVFQARVLAAETGGAGPLVQLALTERRVVPLPRPRLTVVHALPKGRKLDEVVQRLSEVGADRLVPVRSVRSQVDLHAQRAERALDRWRAVALAAAKQSRRARLLVVEPIASWEDAFARVRAAGAGGVVLWESATAGLSTAMAPLRDTAEVVLGVGPEGGLTAEEVEGTGLPAVTLGPTILRTETAALVGTVAIAVHLGRLA